MSKRNRSHQCLEQVMKYLESEIIFREVRHVCHMHKKEWEREGRQDPCELLGKVETDKLDAWDRAKQCLR